MMGRNLMALPIRRMMIDRLASDVSLTDIRGGLSSCAMQLAHDADVIKFLDRRFSLANIAAGEACAEFPVSKTPNSS
jgi:hypothetical protein